MMIHYWLFSASLLLWVINCERLVHNVTMVMLENSLIGFLHHRLRCQKGTRIPLGELVNFCVKLPNRLGPWHEDWQPASKTEANEFWPLCNLWEVCGLDLLSPLLPIMSYNIYKVIWHLSDSFWSLCLNIDAACSTCNYHQHKMNMTCTFLAHSLVLFLPLWDTLNKMHCRSCKKENCCCWTLNIRTMMSHNAWTIQAPAIRDSSWRNSHQTDRLSALFHRGLRNSCEHHSGTLQLKSIVNQCGQII